MLALKEITEWKGVTRQPNHTYLLDGDKIVAYKQWHTGEPIYSNSKPRINKRYRKFIEVDISVFGKAPEPVLNIKTITGSKGNTYTLDLDAKTCDCPGFSFRGKCKHIEKELAI